MTRTRKIRCRGCGRLFKFKGLVAHKANDRCRKTKIRKGGTSVARFEIHDAEIKPEWRIWPVEVTA